MQDGFSWVSLKGSEDWGLVMVESEQVYAPRILVVDDEPDVRKLLVNVLKRQPNYAIYQASDGIEAKNLLSSKPFDLVIADLVMPKMDGLSLMRWAGKNCPDPTWIILSGEATVDRAVEAVRLGAFDFLCKPLDVIESLYTTVANALEQRKLSAEQERLHRELEDRNARLNDQVNWLTRACVIMREQADTIEDDLRRAELIQQALLPRVPPPVRNMAVNVTYRPSRKVGGDLYDVVWLNDQYLVVYVADAAGHGVSAAMLAVLFKHRLGMLDDQYNPRQPAEVFDSVNQALLAECAAPGLFITAAYCLINVDTGEVEVSSAGHPPLLVCRADGKGEMIYHSGPALGISPDAKFAQKHLQIAQGDRILIYTDGLCHAPDQRKMLTSQQIFEMLGNTEMSGQSVVDNLLEAAAVRRDKAPQADDVTIVLLTVSSTLTSCFDNGPVSSTNSVIESSLAPDAQVLFGSQEDQARTVSIEGKGTWVHCRAFHEYCSNALNAGCTLTLDMSLCMHLDSTFLGTILEMAALSEQTNIPLQIQGALPEVRSLFQELEMEPVLKRLTTEMIPLPSQMTAMTDTPKGDILDQERILHAHQALASMSDRNRAEFGKLIEYVRKALESTRGGE